MQCNMLGGLCCSATGPPVSCGMTVNAALRPNSVSGKRLLSHASVAPSQV